MVILACLSSSYFAPLGMHTLSKSQEKKRIREVGSREEGEQAVGHGTRWFKVSVCYVSIGYHVQHSTSLLGGMRKRRSKPEEQVCVSALYATAGRLSTSNGVS